jgi:hypothetical protein
MSVLKKVFGQLNGVFTHYKLTKFFRDNKLGDIEYPNDVYIGGHYYIGYLITGKVYNNANYQREVGIEEFFSLRGVYLVDIMITDNTGLEFTIEITDDAVVTVTAFAGHQGFYYKKMARQNWNQMFLAILHMDELINHLGGDPGKVEHSMGQERLNIHEIKVTPVEQ